jgi:hypothetical protein
VGLLRLLEEQKQGRILVPLGSRSPRSGGGIVLVRGGRGPRVASLLLPHEGIELSWGGEVVGQRREFVAMLVGEDSLDSMAQEFELDFGGVGWAIGELGVLEVGEGEGVAEEGEQGPEEVEADLSPLVAEGSLDFITVDLLELVGMALVEGRLVGASRRASRGLGRGGLGGKVAVVVLRCLRVVFWLVLVKVLVGQGSASRVKIRVRVVLGLVGDGGGWSLPLPLPRRLALLLACRLGLDSSLRSWGFLLGDLARDEARGRHVQGGLLCWLSL